MKKACNTKMGKIFTKEEVDIKSLSVQIESIKQSLNEFISNQDEREKKQEERLNVLEKIMTKENALYSIRQIEIRAVYAGVASLLTYVLLK